MGIQISGRHKSGTVTFPAHRHSKNLLDSFHQKQLNKEPISLSLTAKQQNFKTHSIYKRRDSVKKSKNKTVGQNRESKSKRGFLSSRSQRLFCVLLRGRTGTAHRSHSAPEHGHRDPPRRRRSISTSTPSAAAQRPRGGERESVLRRHWSSFLSTSAEPLAAEESAGWSSFSLFSSPFSVFADSALSAFLKCSTVRRMILL